MKNILLIEDHFIVAVGIERIIAENFPNSHFFHVSTDRAALDIIRDKPIDFVIQDINLPNVDSSYLLKQMLTFNKALKVLMFSNNPEEVFAKHYLQNGAVGYLNKQSAPNEIITAIQQINQGRSYMSSALKDKIADDLIFNRSANPFDRLTSRELEVMTHLLKMKTSKEICGALSLHSSSVATHKSHIFTKTGTSSLVELAELARIYHVNK